MREYLSDFVAAPPEDREAGRDRDHDAGPRDRRGADHPGAEAKGGHAAAQSKDRPAVLYQGTTHAREWISTEVTRRLMEYFAGNSTTARKLRRTRELWFLPVVNPDGYQYTFDHERLWRKNLRDNDGDGQITNLDGVDINRNYPEHWGYDDEGSNTEISSETYRGTAAGLGARDPGEHRLRRQDRPGAGGQLPLLRPAAALPGGLAGADAGARPPGLPRAQRQRRRARPSRAPIPTSRPSSTRPTASSPTGPTTSRTCSPGPRS